MNRCIEFHPVSAGLKRYLWPMATQKEPGSTLDLPGLRAPRNPRPHDPLVGTPVRLPLSRSNRGAAPPVLAGRDRQPAFLAGRDHAGSPGAEGRRTRPLGRPRRRARSEFLDRFSDAARTLDVDGVRRSLDQAVEMVGLERAIVEVTMPGMRELGDQWQSGRCDVATEHAATGVVRQWFARLSAATPPPFRSRPLVLAYRAHRTPHDRPGGLRGPARQAWVADRHARRAHPHGCAHHRAHVLPSRRDGRHR